MSVQNKLVKYCTNSFMWDTCDEPLREDNIGYRGGTCICVLSHKTGK